MPSQAKPNFKCIIIGDSGVGKTCLMVRFAEDTFKREFASTIGVDFTNRNIELDGERIKCQLWDTAGQERFRTLTTSYYREAQGVVIVYDVGSRRSFDNVSSWLDDVCKFAAKHVCILLVGNKVDLADDRAVSYDEGRNRKGGQRMAYCSLRFLPKTATTWKLALWPWLSRSKIEAC